MRSGTWPVIPVHAVNLLHLTHCPALKYSKVSVEWKGGEGNAIELLLHRECFACLKKYLKQLSHNMKVVKFGWEVTYISVRNFSTLSVCLKYLITGESSNLCKDLE